MADEVLLDVDERGVATVPLNRPEVNNAYNGDVIEGLISAFTDIAANDAARIAVLRGNGRHFQAGADLRWIRSVAAADQAENHRVSTRTATAIRALNEFPKPTVALVHGGCFGGGIGMISCCDVVIASEDAFFSITETRWGLVPSIIVPQLNGAIGVRNVRRYALSAERFGATRAKEMGLVHELCMPGVLDETAAPIIDALLKSSPEAMRVTKACVLAHANLVVDDPYFAELVDEHAAKRQTEEAAEGLASFVERRDPAWYPAANK